MLDKYYAIKEMYSDDIVIYKCGKFYYAYKEDAYIISYLLGYRISNNDSVGFPYVDKVVSKLKTMGIGYIIYDNSVIREYGDSVNYKKYLDLALVYLDKEAIINDIVKLLYKLDIAELEKLVLTLR